MSTRSYVVPDDVVVPTSPVGRSLVMPYFILGRLPERTADDAVRSFAKHMSEVLDEVWPDPEGVGWEVRLYDEPGTFRLPFCVVAPVGDELLVGNAVYADVTQAMTAHAYPHPAQDAERSRISAERLRSYLSNALQFGAGRGRARCVPLWDHGAAPDLYQDTEARHPSDFMRLNDLSVGTLVNPEDDREVEVIVNIRAQWRRARTIPGHLVQSVRLTEHPD